MLMSRIHTTSVCPNAPLYAVLYLGRPSRISKPWEMHCERRAIVLANLWFSLLSRILDFPSKRTLPISRLQVNISSFPIQGFLEVLKWKQQRHGWSTHTSFMLTTMGIATSDSMGWFVQTASHSLWTCNTVDQEQEAAVLLPKLWWSDKQHCN